MGRPVSLTARIALLFALLTASLLIVVGAVLGRAVEAHFRELDQHELGGKLNRRRLAMLRDPAPESMAPGARRADEVDTLYALPHSIGAIAPRLRRYLELLFQQGTWSLPPPS